MAHLSGDATLNGTEAAWTALQAEITALQDGDAATIRKILARHHVVLEVLTAHLLRKVASQKRPDHAAALARAAASVQQADLRTLVALGSIGVKGIN
jgi:hypothetical protein